VQAINAAQGSRIQSRCSIAGAPCRRGFNSSTVRFYDRIACCKSRQPRRWNIAATIQLSERRTRNTVTWAIGALRSSANQRTAAPDHDRQARRDQGASRGVKGMLLKRHPALSAIVHPICQPSGTRDLPA
jgi:hypothetical protein